MTKHQDTEVRTKLFWQWIIYHKRSRLAHQVVRRFGYHGTTYMGFSEYRDLAWGCIRQGNVRIHVQIGETYPCSLDTSDGPPQGSLVMFDMEAAACYYRWMRDVLGIVIE